jgi:hypothetical protein
MQNEIHSSKGEELTQIISEEAEQAYAEFLAEHPGIDGAEHPWDSPYCFGITRYLQPRLAQRGINARIISGGGHRHGIDDTHEFLETDEEVVICPTWHQVVPDHVKQAFPNLPHVLVVPRDLLEDVLNFYQVPHIQQLLFNVPEDPEAPWGLDEQTPPLIEEHDAVLQAIRWLINTMRPPHQ